LSLGFQAAAGGFVGAAMREAVTMGFKRGVFSNEAGLGSSVSDTLNGLMALPNLIGVIFLSGTVFAITKNYLARQAGNKTLKPMISAYPSIQAEQEAKMKAED
jgi:Na+/alanine symporter